ncbi:MAG TPA: HAD-IC family P-type ATPase, partial [Vicinamibacteria bacterium]
MATSPKVEGPPQAWHALPAEEVASALGVGLEGLTSAEAASRLAEAGPNALVVAEPEPAWRILVSQGKSLVVLLLAVASVLALLFGDVLDSIAIAAVLVLNAVIGFSVELRARRAMEGLRRLEVAKATVIRDGEPRKIDAKEVVPGELVVLEAGESIPADARLVSTTDLRVTEAPLTGESAPVAKQVEPVGDRGHAERTALAERASMVYKGTLVAAGSARALVTGTGPDTEVGRISELVQTTETEPAPLEMRLRALGRRLVGAALVVAALVTGVGILRGGDLWLMVETGIALAIAAVPEGLPVVATITLALGMRRMAARKALVRSLPAVEALGSTTVICSDKTGTLTGGKMTATVLEVAGRRLSVSGGGETQGQVLQDEKPVGVSDVPGLEMALRISVLANRARIAEGPDARIEGDPTEGALLVLARKLGIGREALIADHPEIGEVPFTSERKLMATFHGKPDGGRLAFVKGAPDTLAELSTGVLTPEGTVPVGPAERTALLRRNGE